MGKSDEQLRERLQAIVDGCSQAEVARETGTLTSSISRYLSGRSMPAAFLSTLVERMNINPEWLLTGEGRMKKEEVTVGTARMASDILELVEALNAVTQLRLSALTGRRYQQVLRELSNALTNVDTLRTRLDAYSSDVFRKLLDDLGRALNGMELDRARDIQRTTEQVSRLCTDPAMQREYLRMSTHIAYLSGDHEATLNLLRKTFFLAQMGDELAEEEAQDAGHYALTLALLDRQAEAERYSHAIVALLGDKERPVLYWMRFFLGMLALEQGRVDDALQGLHKNIGYLTGNRFATGQAILGQAMLMAGVYSVPDAIKYGADIQDKAVNILLFSVWWEDADDLISALRFAESSSVQCVDGHLTSYLQMPKLLLKILSGGKVSVPKLDLLAPESENTKAVLQYLIQKVQILRLQGKAALARKAYAKADKLVASSPQLVLVMACHYNNARHLGVDKTAAEDWFSRHTWCDEVRRKKN